HHVAEDDVEAIAALEHVERLASAGGAGDVVLGAEEPLYRLAHQRLVVDHQDPGPRPSPSPRLARANGAARLLGARRQGDPEGGPAARLALDGEGAAQRGDDA